MHKYLDYFAYGSNLNLQRLRNRTPSCVALGVAKLTGYRLCFHKRSPDGSGKCNILHTGVRADRVYGVLYRLEAREKPLLDNAEGVGGGYNTGRVRVRVADTEIQASTYFADRDYIDNTLRPYDWYKGLVVSGARMHNLPEPYILQIEQREAVADLDVSRAQLHWRIVGLRSS